MAFNFLVWQLTIGGYSLPLKAPTCDSLLTGEWLSGPPAGWGFDSVRIGDDTIVLSTEFIYNSGVFFVN